MRMAILAAILVGIVGCGGQPATITAAPGRASGASAQPKPKPSPPKPAPEIQVSPNAYADVAQAFDALLAGIKTNDHKAVFTAETWLAMQKSAAVGPLQAIVKNPDEPLERRLAASRALGRVGPPATDALLECLDVDPEQLRLRTVETLGLVKPSSPEIVDKLIELLNGRDDRTRQIAIGSLARIGAPARRAVPDLLEILNNTQEPEALRSDAKRALKEIDPRRGLQGVAR